MVFACIATNVGSHGEVLDNGAGIILELPQIKQQLVKYLMLLIEQPELAQSFGKKARQRILERYSLSSNLNLLEDIYEQALKKRQNRTSKPNFWLKTW